jgi:cell wall-associated NlpC family hydrolase
MSHLFNKQLPARIYSNLPGLPYRDGGRGPTFFDCLGLAIELQRLQGRMVLDYSSTLEEYERQLGPARGVLGPAVRLESPEPGCVVLLRMPEGRPHLGTMLDRYRMLHTTEQTRAAVIESLTGPLWSRRVLGYYAPEGPRQVPA